MPRRPRIFLPDQPQHVVVRGHNRDPVFARHEDFRFFYRCLRDAASRNALAVHAWVLMHNHVHLLVTPANERALPSTMQSVGRRYAQYFNRCYHRSGALWEGRYKAALVDSERYLLACYRYIELNPVRAGIVRRPEDYPYSSYHANALDREDGLVTPHRVYLALGSRGRSRSASRQQGSESFDTARNKGNLGFATDDSDPGASPRVGQGSESFDIAGARANAGLAIDDSDPGTTRASRHQGSESFAIAGARANAGLAIDDSDPGRISVPPEVKARYRSLFDEAIPRKTLTRIRRGTEKELGIGQADFLLRVAKRISGGK